MVLVVEIFAVVLAAVVLAKAFGRLGLPALLGMILGGGVAAAATGHWLAADLRLAHLSSDLRLAVLVVLLLRAGLGLSKEDLKHAGGLAFRLGWIPMVCEALVVALVARQLLGLSLSEALALGFLVAPVSPAIVIPATIQLLQRRTGAGRRVPAALLAGAPLDNIAAVVALGVALDLATGRGFYWAAAVGQVIGAVLGGVVAGLVVGLVFARATRPLAEKQPMVVALLYATAVAVVALGQWLGFSFILAIIAAGATIRAADGALADDLARGLAGVWQVAQYLLFGLIGAAVDVRPMFATAGVALVLVLAGQLGRALASLLATARSGLYPSERLACILGYLPKATIQAAFASLALDRGLPAGNLHLSVAVLAIVITAPAGLLALTHLVPRLLPAQRQSEA